MEWSKIPGQAKIKATLQLAVHEGNVPHAMCFLAEEGAGALPMALALVNQLMCENPRPDGACGVCPKCSRIEKLIHPDIHFIFPVNTTASVKRDPHSDLFLEDWRKALKENPFITLNQWLKFMGIENKQGFIGKEENTSLNKKIALRSFEGGYKVFIIWNADKMNETFANKILKNLEEPPDKTLFVLITDRIENLLPTIISRTQIVHFSSLTDSELGQFLVENYGLDTSTAQAVAMRAEGNVSRALADLSEEGHQWVEVFREWMRRAYSRDVAWMYEFSENMAKKTRDEQKQFLENALRILHKCFKMAWRPESVQGEEADLSFYKKFSIFINQSNIFEFVELMERALFHVERNVNEKMIWFDTSMHCTRLIKQGKTYAEMRA